MSAIAWPDPLLRSGQVLLRPWNTGDLPALVALGQDPSIARWFPVLPYPYTEQDAADWLDSEERGRRDGGGISFALAHADTGEVLGGMSLGNISELLSTASISYWLAAQARGHGYMTPTVQIVAHWAFRTLRLIRLEASIDPDNVASQRVAERCGFHREGCLRSSMIVRQTGERRDALIYGLLLDDLVEPDGSSSVS